MLFVSGVMFVDKMDQFIRRAQSVDNTPSDLNSEYSVQRCVQINFHRLRLSRRSVYLTIIPLALVGYEMVNSQRGA